MQKIRGRGPAGGPGNPSSRCLGCGMGGITPFRYKRRAVRIVDTQIDVTLYFKGGYIEHYPLARERNGPNVRFCTFVCQPSAHALREYLPAALKPLRQSHPLADRASVPRILPQLGPEPAETPSRERAAGSNPHASAAARSAKKTRWSARTRRRSPAPGAW